MLDRSGEVLERDSDLLRFLIRVMLDGQQHELDEINLVAEPVVAFYRELVDRATARKELARRDADRLVRVISILVWGIVAAAATDPSGVESAVKTAKWLAASRFE